MCSAEQRDAADALAPFRRRFYLSAGCIYLDGNSLGPLSDSGERALLEAVAAWKRSGIDGWTSGDNPWYYLPGRLAEMLAPMLGAHPDSVAVTGSTTVNLHQLISTLYRPDPARPRIVVDSHGFPSALYALRSELQIHGRDPAADLVMVPSRDGRTLREDDVIAAMTDDVQIVVLSSVLFGSGQMVDMALLTGEAHRRGILIGFDCAHSVGVVPHAFDAIGIDFAVWCSYKYMNAGPGAVGGLYLNRRHFGRAPGLAGWFGSRPETQFDMAPELDPAHGAASLQIGSPHILSLAPLLGSLEIIAEAGIERIRAKSLAMTGYLMDLANTELAPLGFGIATPREEERRGGHVSLTHPCAVQICQALKARGVVPDYRPPDIVRFAPAPLYNTFTECWEAVQLLKTIVTDRLYEACASQRGVVA